MNRIAILLAPLAPLALASVAVAQATLPDVPDTDGNGNWSMVELQAVWTDLTEDTFKTIDTTADGAVDATELQAALDGGVIKAPGEASGG